jgi:hypothetical protein
VIDFKIKSILKWSNKTQLDFSMLFSRLSAAIFLSLLFALGTGLSQAHSHDSVGAHDGYGSHDAEQCVYSVVQSTSLTIAPDSLIFASITDSKSQTATASGSVICPLILFAHARAPPSTSK